MNLDNIELKIIKLYNFSLNMRVYLKDVGVNIIEHS
jgi:hypothetical protein